MSIHRSRAHALARRLRRTWSELNYVQRRAFEIQTGIEIGAGETRGRRDSVVELERLYRIS